MSLRTEKILVIGGILGLRLSVSLFDVGYDIIHVGRRKTHELGQHIVMDGIVYPPPPITQSLSVNEHYDVIFVATKLYDTQSVLSQLQNHGIDSDIIAVIQNGLVPNDFYKGFDTHKIISLSIVEGVQLIGNILTINSSDQGRQISATPQGQSIAKVLRTAKIPYTLSHDMQSTRIWKMLMNCTLNGLSAIHNRSIGELINYHNQSMIELFNESYDVLHQQFPLSNKRAYQISLWDAFKKVSNHYTTTYQDIHQQRKSEIDFLNKYIIDLGEEFEMPTPANQEIYQQVKRIERGYL